MKTQSYTQRIEAQWQGYPGRNFHSDCGPSGLYAMQSIDYRKDKEAGLIHITLDIGEETEQNVTVYIEDAKGVAEALLAALAED